MPRRSILSAAERESLVTLPDTEDELNRHYTFSETDLSLIRLRRGDANRLGAAVDCACCAFQAKGCCPIPRCRRPCCNGLVGNCVPIRRAGQSMPGARKPGVSISLSCAPTLAWNRSA